MAALLAAGSTASQAQWYVGGALGTERAKVDDFRFHNPVGAAGLGIGGSYIPLGSVQDRDTGSLWSLRAGYRFPAAKTWRAEFDYTKRSEVEVRGTADFGGGGQFRQDLKIRSESYLLMALYDHALDQNWALYGGAGLGVARNRSNGHQGLNNPGGNGYFPGATKTNTAWALTAGVSRKLTANLTGDVGYRFVDLGRADTGTTDASFAAVGMNPNERLESKLRTHELRLGINYSF